MDGCMHAYMYKVCMYMYVCINRYLLCSACEIMGVI